VPVWPAFVSGGRVDGLPEFLLQEEAALTPRGLLDPFTGRPDLEEVVAVEPHGRNFDGDLLVVSRTITWVGHGLNEIPAESAEPPTEAETNAVHAALDYLGYTGPREIRLLLAVSCT